MPEINLPIMRATLVVSAADLASTPDSAIMNPITVPISPERSAETLQFATTLVRGSPDPVAPDHQAFLSPSYSISR